VRNNSTWENGRYAPEFLNGFLRGGVESGVGGTIIGEKEKDGVQIKGERGKGICNRLEKKKKNKKAGTRKEKVL